MSDVTLIAHSFGARVAIKLAKEFGYFLDKLVIVDGAGIKPRRKLKYYYSIYKHKILKRLKIVHSAGSADYKALPTAMKGTFINIVNEDLTPLLKFITLPTLIVWGENDRETPLYMAKKMHRLIANSGLVVLKNAGHFSYIDQYQKFIAVLGYFLESKGG